MSEESSRHSRCAVNKSYPDPKVECKNLNYANILLQDYAGAVSELTAITLYSYQHFSSAHIYKDYAELIEAIAVVEMRHMELLGKTIRKLGVKPAFIDSVYTNGRPWNATYVNYNDNIIAMLEEDIKSESKAIENYENHLCIIEDRYIKKLLERIILDEKHHLRCFGELYKKYKRHKKS